ncbi:hypothetical protein [Bradyrhizobium cytisi]|uniref:Uncharacterized protein n=1 Tax=Bradyrhizobium cytisi TaxID=515489 RepID=A0A5S4X1M5_9BRAD|nr:hypothetical protein [Bradyrhizobium cytisi]TYL87946.1 hypothetical protein FXB38_02120 [Bradyrhizobium cytisi]
MKTLVLDKRASLSSDDVVVFHQKPNVILYSFEASKLILLFILGLNVVQVFGLHLLRHASLIFLVKLTLLIDSLLLPIFFIIVLLIASGLTFIVTRADVGTRPRTRQHPGKGCIVRLTIQVAHAGLVKAKGLGCE